jgi:hypothetical protein
VPVAGDFTDEIKRLGGSLVVGTAACGAFAT